MPLPRYRACLLLITVLTATAAWPDESTPATTPCSSPHIQGCKPENLQQWLRWLSIAGPDQVERRLSIDALPGDPLIDSHLFDRWQAYKNGVEQENGVSWSTDYIAAYMHASDSLGDDTGAGASLRFSGVWNVSTDEEGNSGALIWKLEHRHAYGSNVSPQGLAAELGYAGLVNLTLSDQRGRLTNLYWRQRMAGGKLILLGGWLDTSDYVDVYMLASPWTGFFNYAFSTGSAAMPVPNEGLGMALGGFINDKLYLIGGFADANSDPHRPDEAFDTFFRDQEYFKHLELGWTTSRDLAFLNNIHLTLWQVDERKQAGVSDGWGANLSWSRLFAQHWTTFVRAGYTDDGGSILEQSVSAGFGWSRVRGGNQLGVGLNWGVPNEDTYGPDLAEQTTLEVFYRLQLFEELALTPNIQYLRDPALNQAEDSIWILGLRARFAL